VSWLVEAQERWYGKARRPHYGTVLAAGREGRPGADEALARLAGDIASPAIVRATALSLLGRYSGAPATAAFRAALSDPDPLIRRSAEATPPGVGPKDFVRWVAPLLFDPVRAVRIEAAAQIAGAPPDLLTSEQAARLPAVTGEYEAAMSRSLDFAHAGHNLGNLYVHLRDPQRAEKYYREAIAVDGRSFPTKVNLAVLLNGEGRNGEAEVLLREVLRDEPDRNDVRYSLALLVAEEKKYDEAASLLQKVVAAEPSNTRARYNLGLVFETLGRDRDAEASLSAALAGEPDSVEYLQALAQLYVQRRDPRKAAPLVAQLVERHPESPAGPALQRMLDRAGHAGAGGPSR
jgi:tetratricopeptide (TPR) repeat protein